MNALPRGAVTELEAEMGKAETRYGAFRSTHEAYGVLIEEVAELFDAIRANNLRAVRREAMQIAAVALRLANHCEPGARSDFVSRSTK